MPLSRAEVNELSRELKRRLEADVAARNKSGRGGGMSNQDALSDAVARTVLTADELEALRETKKHLESAIANATARRGEYTTGPDEIELDDLVEREEIVDDLLDQFEP